MGEKLIPEENGKIPEKERILSGKNEMLSEKEGILSGKHNMIPDKDWSQYSPLTLAWMGDAVFELYVRTAILSRGNMQTEKLHRRASAVVCAQAQAALVRELLPMLTDEEKSIYRRGRNAHPGHTAKNAAREEYLEATGLECLIGYLYLMKREDRILELIQRVL